MDGAPKRSVGETIGQLIVIAVLIGILIGAILLLRQYVNNHNSSAPISTKAVLTFKGCTEFNTVTDQFHASIRPGVATRASV
jgi:hypothetical protein